jgi:hypothetical protein
MRKQNVTPHSSSAEAVIRHANTAPGSSGPHLVTRICRVPSRRHPKILLGLVLALAIWLPRIAAAQQLTSGSINGFVATPLP